jgi:hypothetical protein
VRQRDQDFQRRERPPLRQRARQPEPEVGLLQRDARRVTNEAVGVVELGERAFGELRREFVGVQLAPETSRVHRVRVAPRRHGDARRRAHQSIDRRLRAPAADQEIERAVGPELEVGQRERLAADERCERRRVARAARLEADRVELAVRPIGDEDRAAALRRELGREAAAAVRDEAGRRRDADVDDAGQRVRVIRRPTPRARAPAVVAAARDVLDHRRPIPRQTDVPLHVGVERQQLAFVVERDVVLVAEAAREELPVLAVAIDAADPAAGRRDADRVPVRIGALRQQHVLAPRARHARARELGQLRVVSADDPQPIAMRVLHDRVRAVLARAFERAQQLGLGEAPVVERAGPPESGHDVASLLRHDDVERAERVAETLRVTERERQLFDFLHDARRERHAIQRAVLIARDDAAAIVEAHRDPRALRAARHGVDELRAIAVGHGELLRRRRAHRRPRLCVVVAPRLVAERCDLDRGLPRARVEVALAPARDRAVAGEPLRIADDALRRAVVEREIERELDARGPAFVLHFEREHVVAFVQEARDVDARRRRPILVLEHFLAVDRERAEIVRCDDERRRLRRASERERAPEPRALAVRRAFFGAGARPDPTRDVGVEVGEPGGAHRELAQPHVADADLHRRALVQLEREDAVRRGLRRVEVVERRHRHAVDRERERRTAGDDAIGVPVVDANVLEQLRTVGELDRRARAVGVVAQHFAAPRHHAATFLLVDAAGPVRTVLEVGLVAGDLVPADVAAAELQAGIAADELELELDFEVGDFAATPEDPRGLRERVRRGRTTDELAVFDAPIARIAVPAVERLAVEDRSRRLGEARRRETRAAGGAEEEAQHRRNATKRPARAGRPVCGDPLALRPRPGA